MIPKYIYKKNYGKIPKYIKKFQKERENAEMMKLHEETERKSRQARNGYVSQEEREELLHVRRNKIIYSIYMGLILPISKLLYINIFFRD